MTNVYTNRDIKALLLGVKKNPEKGLLTLGAILLDKSEEEVEELLKRTEETKDNREWFEVDVLSRKDGSLIKNIYSGPDYEKAKKIKAVWYEENLPGWLDSGRDILDLADGSDGEYAYLVQLDSDERKTQQDTDQSKVYITRYPINTGHSSSGESYTEEERKNLKRYYVKFRVDARYVVEVMAPTLEKSKEEGEYMFSGADFGECENIDGIIVAIEDEDGNYVYERD